MANIFECWEKFKGTDLHKLIAKRTGIEHPLTVQDKEAYRKAAEDFQKENINNLNNIYSDLGLKDYKKTEPPKESIPSENINLQEGNKIQWDSYGNEGMEEWTVGNKVKTRGGRDAVVLSKTYIESSKDGKTYSKEYADANGIKYDNEHTVEHIVPLSELKSEPKEQKAESIPSVSENKKTFITSNREEVSGKRLSDALNKVADDWAEMERKIREEDKYASHVSEKQKDENLSNGLKRAEDIRDGVNTDNFTIWQRINYELTGESVPLFSDKNSEQSLPKEQAPSVSGVDGGFTAKGGNKVVDEKGEPISLYHYSPTGKINEFFVEKSKHGGIYFGDKDYFGKDFDFLLNNDKGALTEVNVKATKIASLEDAGVRFTDELTPNKINKLKEKGFDALYGEGLSGNEYVIFDEKNIQVVNEQSLPKEQKAPSVSGVDEHATNIKTKFREQFKAKGVSDEHIDGALALMDARAKSWASEEKGRTPEQWYQQIADVKNGEFETSDVQYQGGKFKAVVIGTMAVLHPMKINEAKAEVRTEQTSKSQSKDERAVVDILNNYYKENDETPPQEVIDRALYLWDKFGRPEIAGDSTKNDDRAFATNEGGKIKLGNITNFDDFIAELSHSAQYVSGKKMDNREYSTQAERDKIEYKRKGSMENKAHKEVEPILAKYIFIGDSAELNKIQYQESGGVKHGALETLADGRVVIHALDSPDVSTMVHEIGHIFEKDLTETEQKTVKDFGGSEAFARGFERYLRDGNAPSTELKTLFEKFKEWLTNIYKSLKGSAIAKDVSPEIKQIFDRLLTEQKADEKINQQGNETPKSETDKSDQQSQLGSAKKSQQPPKPPEETKGAAEGQENKVGIHVEYPPTSVNYMGTGKLETEFGIEEREPTQRKRDIYTIKEADELLDKGWNIQKELNKVDSGEKTFISDAEYINFTRYAAELSDRLRGIKDVKSPEYDRTLRELNRVANAANTAGKDTARALGIRGRFSTVAEGSYGEFMLNEMAANNDAPLTEKQKETAHAEFEKLDATRKKLDEDTKAFEEKVSAFRAEQELGKTKKSASSGKKRTHEDLVKEREDILKNIGNKWKDAGKDVLSSDIPFRKQIAAIAPDVLKLAKNLVEDGIIKLEDVVKNIHEKIKPNAPEVEEKDIHDIIAGEYNKKKITKKDAAIAMENLRIEAQLLNKYERLLKGEEPKNEKAKRKRNQEIEDLRKKIKDLRKEESESNKFYGESDAAERKEFDNEKREANKFYGEEKDAELKKLESLQKRNESETKKIKEKIAEGDFELPVKKTPLMEDKELQKKFPEQFKATQKAVDDYIKVKREIALRRLKQMYENKTPEEKTIEIFSKALNVPRTLMASFDFSAPLRQAIVATTAHPQIASKALKFMFEAAKDEKVYNRWIDNVHSDPRWSVAEKTKLGITDPESLHVKKAEEAFQGAPYAEKIPIVGVGVKASERAYIGFLNKLRWDLFNMYADRFEEQGKTYENNQKLYEGISSFINSETGRGGMKGLENAAPVLNWFLFASKLIASRLNMLGLSDIPNLTVRGATLGKYGLDYGFYTRLPKEIRIEAAKDMAKFLAVGIATLVLANQLGASVELDPRSSDFGKIKIGNTRWDIWGGFQPYARVLTQSLTGERKTTTTGNIQQLDGKGFMGQTRFTPIINFARGKLAPVPASVIDLAIKKDAAGQPVTIQGELIGDVVPLVIQDTYAAMKDQGVKALFTVGIPSAFGVGVQTYKPREIKSTQQKIKSMNKSSSKKTANKNMNK